MAAPDLNDRAARRAWLYTLTHRGTAGDAEFYAKRTSAASRILELGCGAGRILEAIARSSSRSARIVGLDRNRAMLARARAATEDLGVHLVCGDMRRFAFRARFDCIVIPYNALYALPTDEDMIACLSCAAAHLAPDGEIVFDGYVTEDADPDSQSDDPEMEQIGTVIDAGHRIDIFEGEVPSGRLHGYDAIYRYVVTAPDGRQIEEVITIEHHYIPRWRLPRILAEAGLGATVYGGFDERDFDADSEQMVVVAKPTAPVVEMPQ